jgi:hypothetical protein
MLDIAEVIVGLVLISIAVGILWGGSIVHLKAKRAHRMGMGLAPAVVLAGLLMSAGCHAQVPAASTGYNVTLTWTAPAASGTSQLWQAPDRLVRSPREAMRLRTPQRRPTS